MEKIVGSRAAYNNLDGWSRYGNDCDIWSTEELPPFPGNDTSIMPLEVMEAFEDKIMYASLNDLYTIKISHMPWDIFWDKHLQDALALKLKFGGKINQPLYEALKKFWKVKHGNKDFLKLYQDKTEFFNVAVVKYYDHDWLHEVVSSPDQPVYKSVLKDGETVFTDRDKFMALPHDQKVKMLREEMTVIAFERWLIPLHKKRVVGRMSVHKAWSLSLRKTTTALTKGVYSEFICENLEHFIYPNFGIFERVKKELKMG